MCLRRILVMLTASAVLGIGLIPATSAYAGSGTLTARAGSVSLPKAVHRPDVVIQSANVDVKTADHNGTYCGEFKGTLVYQAYYSGKNYEYYFDVTGKLYARCGATAHLRAYWTPTYSSPQSALIGDTTGTQDINWYAENSYTISAMYVEVCVFNSPVAGCADSQHLE